MLSTIPIWGYPVMVLYAYISHYYTGWLSSFRVMRRLGRWWEELPYRTTVEDLMVTPEYDEIYPLRSRGAFSIDRPLPPIGACRQAYREYDRVATDERGVIATLPAGHTISSFGDSFVALTSDNAEAPQGTPYSKSKPHWTRYGDHGTAGGMLVYCNPHGYWWNEGMGQKPCKLCKESRVEVEPPPPEWVTRIKARHLQEATALKLGEVAKEIEGMPVLDKRPFPGCQLSPAEVAEMFPGSQVDAQP